MHVHFEKAINAKCDCTILSMSWMGKVPEELPEEEGWKLNRTHYYQEGWLAAGNVRGILGVTFTTSHWKKNISEVPHRTNYNLRGHRAQITLVQWNEPYQKLASCDSSGIIFVWIKFEGRWSIELINDRSTPVTHFSWSHDGRMALICYQDGFVLVGSVAGQRYWSSMLNLDATITSGIWTPDDQHVYFGTSSAQVIVMDVHGMMVSQIQLPVNSSITTMTWSCEKFKMEENEEGESGVFVPKRPLALAVSFRNGLIYLMKNYDDITPIQIYTGMQGILMEWSNSGEYLTVAGSRPVEVINESGVRIHEYFNTLHFYNHAGVRVLNIVIPATECPVTALTWGHNDKRIFVATGKLIHVGWVSKRIASLQLLCRLAIYKSLSTETCVSHLPLPLPVRALISSLHNQTVYSILPNIQNLREFASHPPVGTLRLHCTIIRHDEDVSLSPGTAYTLYVEYLGGLLPILKGKRTSKFRPEFVIFDPQSSEGGILDVFRVQFGSANQGGGYILSSVRRSEDRLVLSDSSESEDVDLCASPRLQRRRHRNRLREKEREREREREQEWERNRQGLASTCAPDSVPPSHLVYNDVLPESQKLVEVTSNIWGTKFKINGLAANLPDNLGQVTYKTSLLHLQPRQMTLLMTELRDDIFISPEMYSHFDDDEEDFSITVGGENPEILFQLQHNHQEMDNSSRGSSSSPLLHMVNRSILQSKLASPNNYFSPVPQRRITNENLSQDEFPYVDLATNSDIIRLRETLRNSLNRESTAREGSLSSNFSSVQSSLATCYNSVCQICENGVVPQSPKRSVVPAGVDCTTGEFHERQNSLHRIKASSLVTRAHIERIDENTATASTSTSTTSPPPLARSGPGGTGSRRSPSRICWTETDLGARGVTAGPSGPTPVPVTAPIIVRRSMSASYLDHAADRQLNTPLDIVANDLLQNSPPKRLVLVKKLEEANGGSGSKPDLKPRNMKEYGKSKSLDSYDLSWWKRNSSASNSKQSYDACPNCRFPINESSARKKKNLGCEPSTSTIGRTTQTPTLTRRLSSRCRTPQRPPPQPSIPVPAHEDRIERLDVEILPRPVPPPAPTHRRSMSLLTPLLKRRELASNGRHNSKHGGGSQNPSSSRFVPPSSPQHQPKSSPNTPGSQRKTHKPSYLSSVSSPFRQLFANSPLLSRRKCKNTTPQPQIIDSSDEEDLPRCQSPFGNASSMKSQGCSIPLASNCFREVEPYPKGQFGHKLRSKKIHDIENSPAVPRRREFLMHNKAPMWNENSQVYQLDFGGRVTQESAKNFQIEFRGKQVMQFGRIDGNAYTLDFQYPFSALQAFAVALANVTQRLK